VVSGGGGSIFGSDYILMLSRAKYKEKEETTGNLITCKMEKNRDVKPFTVTKMLLSFSRGLHRYYGLLPYAVDAGIWKKEGIYYLVDGKKYTEKQVYQKGKDFFTQEVLEKLDKFLAPMFAYGVDDGNDIPDSEEVTKEEEKK
jgi:hypothetical protein